MTEVPFQRARTPEQQLQRREAILATARAMLDVTAPSDISLRDLSREVGLSKSNLVRYFPTREAVFLSVLVADWEEWLDAVDAALPRPDHRMRLVSRHQRIAESLTATLVARPRLCDLLVACQPVLERNIPLETAREFKRDLLVLVTRLATIVSSRCAGDLDDAAAFDFAGMVWLVVAGARPLATPTPVMAEVLQDPELTPLCVGFSDVVTTTLAALLSGLSMR